MAGDAHLSGDDAVLSDLGGTGDTDLCGHHRILSNLHIVRNLAEVVNLHALADDGGFHLGPVNGRSRSDFHIVPDDHIAQVLDFLPGTVRLRGVAEAIGTDDGIGMDDHVVTDDHARVDHHARINDTMLSNMGIVPDIDILKNLRKIPHRGMMAHIGVAAQIHFPAEFGREEATYFSKAARAV